MDRLTVFLILNEELSNVSKMNCLRDNAEGTLLDVHVQPRASRNELAGLLEHGVKIRLTAPPVEGEANKECIRFLSKLFGIPKSRIEIVQGLRSRQKTILIRDLKAETVKELLEENGIS